MSKRLFLLLVFITVYFSGIAQELSNTGLVVIRSDKKPDELFSELRVAKEDTNKVKLLIFLCGYHWYHERNKDSVARYAEAARVLSQKLHYQPGFNEACFILLKSYLQDFQISKAVTLLPAVPKDQQSRFLVMIGERYLFLPGQEKKNLDSAFYYFSDALQRAKSIGARAMKHHSLIALGKYYFSSGQFSKGKNCFLEIIPDFQKTGDRAGEAHIWSELGLYMPDTDSTLKDELWAHGNALKIYHELKDTANEVSVLEDLAGINMYHANFAVSKSLLLRAVQLRKAANIKKRYKAYISLALICHATGNLDEALTWALEAEKNAKSLDMRYNGSVQVLLGMIYADDGQPEKGLQYLLEINNPKNDWSDFVVSKIVEQYLKLNQPQKALSFVRDSLKNNRAINPLGRETRAAMKGDIYAALNNPVLAEKYYLQMIQLDDEAQKSKSREITPALTALSGSEAYYKIAKFYEGQRKYSTAGKYTDRALQIQSFTGNHFYTAHLMQKLWWLKFKIDSASGNYVAAIQHYEKYTALKDSIFNAAKSNQLQHLQVQYETEKKETDIQTRDAQIQSLTQNDLLRQANLEQAHRIRNITIASLVILLILGTVLYRQYLQKQRSSKLISQKNEQLQHLLTEKEWLLKEVHHRVKNNLHTVICLLESQAAYLESDARQANEVSQQRIYAMSLIHQKIYQSEDVKTIDMAVYLPELIQSLEDSFGNNREIHFMIDIESVQLDIAQAVPIALIINEAVTNSIKYAFPGNRQGTIEISMHRTNDQVTLVIADNGIGIDSSLINSASDSLGLQLIKGLGRDIKARVNIDNCHGTRVNIVFHLTPLNRHDYTLKEPEEEEVYA